VLNPRAALADLVTVQRTLIALLLTLALPTVACAAGETISISLPAPDVEWHGPVELSGTVQPAAAGLTLTIAVDGTDVGTATTDVAGTFTATFEASRGGAVTARLPDGAVSTPAALVVVPRVITRITKANAYLGATLHIQIQPSTWTGEVIARTLRGPNRLAARRVQIRDGRARVRLSAPGVERFRAEVELPAFDGLAARTVHRSFRAAGRRLAAGSRGADVRALLRRLAELGFHTPGMSSTLSREATDAVVAFQKAYRLPRTYVVDADDWRRLHTARRIRARHRGSGVHIEIDKTRQILLVVRSGRVRHVIATSTGATGNTPEGKHQIRWKAPSTGTWLGSAILYRTLTFKGNSFAIHGFAPVPPYPASHGCARIPMWAADWLYRQSPVGETVYVYR
jgi:L,D-transpeptidase catalytic domain/Putative peptidoglycan binding domain